ncbi:MAG: BlaI/MecI/CopY family transcriptional regulator [Caulobacter sp. 12-67-6]|nr:MAG: BlaI/MecI/CopY family transcriptional regulator [Caulobacter sp. 12-67-6]OYX69879.1 MAG: BlaI/MecI/CopY family transcriptional regulator [Caulobacter sp. 32-67-35]OYX92260.1 MAG: BlaI/MecI/CopY family transcriptional regulator [Caulobacter sp. 35-67-4]OZA74767.1 MAG: BlaI/MecI/CopY family transcriptional regulator [Caulobacter sp. 39-67-4]HQR88651.1 BlaI/MecI/CopY family transcriptional regulator [Caulobacter sp.]
MRISTAESQVMKALWARSPLSADEIIAALPADQDWADATVKTLLNRLLKKDAIAAERDGRRFLYRPLVAQGDYVHAESQGLLDRLFDGRLAPLVAHFSQREKLSDQDVADLRRLLESLEDGK